MAMFKMMVVINVVTLTGHPCMQDTHTSTSRKGTGARRIWVFWNVMLCRTLSGSSRFKESFCLHLQCTATEGAGKMIPHIGGYKLCTNIASLQATLTLQTSRTRSLKWQVKPVHTCKTRCTLTIEPIDGIHTCARVATGVRVTFIDVIVTVMTSPARITLTVVAITLCQDKHVWQWHKTQVTSRHKYVTSTTHPPLYDMIWTYNVQATVNEINTSTYCMKQNSPLAADEEIPYLQWNPKVNNHHNLLKKTVYIIN